MFNMLFVVFNLLSLLLFLPFLNLLFGQSDTPASTGTAGFSKEGVEAKFMEFMKSYIDSADKIEALGFICVAIIIIFFLKNLCYFLGLYFVTHLRHGVARDLRADVYDKILQLPLGYFSDEKKGDIMARSSSDVLEIEMSVIGSLEMLIRDPLNVIFTLATMILISPQMTLFSLILLPISALIISRIGKSLKRSSLAGQNKQGELLSYLEESLSGLRIIKAFSAENIVSRKYAELNNGVKRIFSRMNIKRDLSAPMSEFLGACVMVGLVWYGGRLILTEDVAAPLTGSQFIVFIILFSNLMRPIQNISKTLVNVNKGLASVERVNAILHADNVIHEIPNAVVLNGFSDKIEYKDVEFSYIEDRVLDRVSFSLSKGKSIALVGESGGGKSTIADLLPRFYDVASGSISIDGVDLKEASVKSVRSLMGIVTQQSILFNDTVFNNIAFGMDDATEAQVIAAAKVANAHNFIEQMPEGYQTNIGDAGNKLSGGQKQRLSIARAVLKNPPILILDEATSALDTESEQLVQGALMNLMKERTSLISGHRLSTIQHADEILVIQKGRVVEQGSHDTLIAKDGVYKRLCDLQGFT